MKVLFRRWILTRKLQSIARHLDSVYNDRRNTVLAERHLRTEAARVNPALLDLSIRARRA